MQKESENKTNIAITRQDMSLLKLSQLPMSSFGLLAVSFAQQILDRAQTNTAVSPMFSLDYLEEDSEAQQPKVEISPVLNLDLRFLLQQMQKMEDTRRQATVNAREQEIILQKITHTTQQNITQQNIQNTYQIRNTVNKQTVQEHSENNTTQVVQKPIENNNTQIVREHTENNTTQIVQKTVENNHTKTVREHTENNNTQVVQRPIENNNTQTVREYTANNSTQTVREHTANNTQIIREHTEDSSTQIIREHTENNTTQVVQRSIENNDTQVIRERVENNGIQAVRERTQGNNTQTVREHTENSDRIQIIRERETVQQSGRGTESDTEQSATGKTSAEKTAEISNFENVQTHIAIQAGARIDSEDHSKENKTDNMQYRGSDTAVIPQRAPQNDTALQYSRESAEAQSGRAVDRKTDENGTESTAETETADGAALVRQGDVYRLKPMTGEESTAYHLRRIIEKTASMQQQRQQRSNRAGAGMRLLGSEAAAAMTQTVESQQNNMTLLPPEAGGQELIFAQETQELDPVTQREKQIAQILHQVKSEMQNIAGEAHSAQADSTKSASAKAAPAFDKSASAASVPAFDKSASAASVPAFEKSVSAASTPASDKSSFAKAVSAKSDSAEVSSTEPGFAAPAENADQRGRAKKEEKVTTAKEDSTQASSFEEPRNELQRKELRTVYLPEKETRESRIPVGARKIGNAKRSENMMLPQLEMLFSNVLQAERSMGLTYGEAENRIPRAPQDRVEFLKKTTQNIIRREQLADAVNAIPAGILPTEELEFLRTITEGPGASGQLIRAAERVVYRTLQLTDRTWAIPEYARPTKQAQDEALARQADLKRELLILTEEQSAAPAVMQEVSAKTTVSVQQEDSAAIPDQEVLQRGRTEQKSVFEKIVQFLRGKENADTFAIEAKGHNAVEVRRALQETAPATVEMDYLSSAEEKQESEPTLSTPDGYADRAMQKESQSGTAMITAQQAAQAVSEIERRGSYEEHLEHEPLQIKYLNEENKKAEIKQRVDAAQKSEAVSREIPMAQLVQADAQLIRSLAYLSQLQDRQAGVEKIVLPVVQMGKTIYLTQPESGESATEYVTRLQKESGKTIRLTEPKTGESAKEYLTRIQKESGEMIYLTQPESGESAVEYVTRLQKESGKVIYVTRSERAQALQNTAIRTDSGSKADRVPATAAQQPVEIEYFSETANQPEHPQQAFRANPIMARRAEEKETVLQARAQTTQAAEQKRSSQPDSVSQPIEMSYVLQGSVEGQSEQQKTSPMQAEQLGQEQKFLKQQAKESSYYNSLPEWTKDFLENGYQGSQSDFRGTAEQTWESRAIPAKNVISWQNPNAEKLNSAMQPPQEIVLKQPEEKEPVEAYVSNSEIRRTADRVYKIIEERLRNERRRRGM